MLLCHRCMGFQLKPILSLSARYTKIYEIKLLLNGNASLKMNLSSKNLLICPINQPFTTVQIIVPQFIPTKVPKKHRDKTTPKTQLQQSYIVFALPIVILDFCAISLTNNSYASGGKYVWNRRATPVAQIVNPAI